MHITKIRLLCFHNFVDELIEVDGHLFLIGGNGSGKTTILDAVHYVLTGGELELNAAARIAGRREDGRDDGDIVLRLNHSRGVMRPDGGIAYAALELADNDRRYTIGVGLRKDGEGAPLSRWGFVFNRELSDTFFMNTDTRRLFDLSEMSAHYRESDKIFGKIGSYRDEVCKRFFGGRENFRNLCSILNTAKSYREMVSRSMQYEELFKRLLPPPPEDVLSEFLGALRQLDSDQEEVRKWQERVDYLDGLFQLLEKVGHLDRLVKCAALLRVERAVREHGDRIADCRQLLVQQTSERQQLSADISRAKERLEHLFAKRSELANLDAEGALNQKEAITRTINALTLRAQEYTDDVNGFQKQAVALSTTLDQDNQLSRACLKQLLEVSAHIQTDLDLDTLAFSQEISGLLNRDGGGAERLMGALPVIRALDHLENRLTEEKKSIESSCKSSESELNELAEEMDRIRKDGGVKPNLMDFEAVEDELRLSGFRAEPLYRLLEWQADVDADDVGVLEQCIGDDILGTFLVAPHHYGKARALIHSQFPGTRLAPWKAPTGTVYPGWFDRFFDKATSDPAALGLLASEMMASADPVLLREEDFFEVGFRAHTAGWSIQPGQFIGEHSRKAAMQARIDELSEEQDEIRAALKSSQKSLKDTRRRLTICQNLHKSLTDSAGKLAPLTDALIKNSLEYKAASERLTEKQLLLTEADEKLASLNKDLLAVQQVIEEKNILELNEQLNTIETEIAQAGESNDALNKQLGNVENRMQQTEEDLEKEHSARSALESELQQMRDAISTSVDDASFDACRKELAVHLTSEATIGRKHDMLMRELETVKVELRMTSKQSAINAVYDLAYDEDRNTIHSRADKSLQEELANARTNLEKTVALLEGKSNDAISRIFEGSLVSTLYRNLHELKSMVSTISDKLKGRQFGDTTYSFRARPKEQFKHIVEGLKELNTLTPDKDRILKDLYAEMKEAAMEMAGDVLPERLDYRTWYDYELHMKVGDKEKRLSDRIRKAGSGGEQAVPNYILILAASHFFYSTYKTRLSPLLFDEGFYGIDASRQDQLLAFAADLKLQLVVATPDVDGTGKEIEKSTTAFIMKNIDNDVRVECFHWNNPLQPELTWTPEQRVTAAHDNE